MVSIEHGLADAIHITKVLRRPRSAGFIVHNLPDDVSIFYVHYIGYRFCFLGYACNEISEGVILVRVEVVRQNHQGVKLPLEILAPTL